ncbi:MAG: DNA-directed RNA polymerase [archaeon]|nr:DNA-directed RNA polymerase [archaeon]
MYLVTKIRDTVSLPPKEFGKDLKVSLLGIVQQEFEGMVDERAGVVLAVMEILNVGEGKVIPGEGTAYYETEMLALMYKPEIQEVVEGNVTEITEFGAFVRTGPIEGLVHVSQIMNDYINYDSKLPGFIGKESQRKLIVEDSVLARIVSVSLKGTIPNSKIGLTMRQVGLGKKDWAQVEAKMKEKKTTAKVEVKKTEPKKAEVKK